MVPDSYGDTLGPEPESSDLKSRLSGRFLAWPGRQLPWAKASGYE
jgi:hypothetical protein